jgi:hypothetical protein
MMAYEYILVGSGVVHIAPEGTTFPTPDQTPPVADAAWSPLGEFDGGVQISHPQTIDEHRTDKETGIQKATRSEEDLTISVSLADQTLENFASMINGDTVVDTPEGSGTAGYREVGMYRGLTVVTYALVFEGNSPYLAGAFLRYLVPRGYFGGDMGQAFVKSTKTLIPVEFHAMVDPNAGSDAEKFGTVQAVDAVALP